MPIRPHVVWAYVAVVIVGVLVNIAYGVTRGWPTLWVSAWSILAAAIVMALIWRGSRIGWAVVALLTAWGAAGQLTHRASAIEGPWGAAALVIHVVGVALLVSPWMTGWVWHGDRSAPPEEPV